MVNLMLVMVGGALGSGARYGLGRWLNGGLWPHGTMIANVAGGLLMGLLMAWLVKGGGDSERARLFLGVGVLGGFTTFSSFSLETVHMLERRDYGAALLYIALSVGLSLAAVALGFLIVRKVAG